MACANASQRQEITGSLLSILDRKRTSVIDRCAMVRPSHGGSRFLILETASESKYECRYNLFDFCINFMCKTKLVKIL